MHRRCHALGVLNTRDLEISDWLSLWPMLEQMGCLDGEAATRERYADLLGDPRWGLLGVEADSLVGYAAVQDIGPHLRAGDHHRTARLHDMFVLDSHRRQGCGRALMQAVEGWARPRVRYLEWQAHEDGAAPFYVRLGYVGLPCPQPEYPTIEVDYRGASD